MSLAFGTTSLACTAALGLLLFGLGFAVSRARFARRRGSGHDDDPRDLLHKLVRAHANTAEFAPFLAVLFLAHGARGHAAWVAWAMAGATACRYLIVAGLVAWPSLDRANPVRFVGALGTYVLGVALSVALLLPA